MNLASLVIDVSPLADFRRNVATIGRFVGARVVSAVTVLQMAFCSMVGTVVFIAGVAFAPAEAVRSSIGIPDFMLTLSTGSGVLRAVIEISFGPARPTHKLTCRGRTVSPRAATPSLLRDRR